MDNKQKRKFLLLVYKTIIFFSIISLGVSIYLCIDKIYNKTSILWLDITLLSYIFLSLCFIVADSITTRKLSNKYRIAKFFYFNFVTSFIAAIALCVYCYIQNIDLLAYSTYILPIGLFLASELMLVVNLVLGMSITKLNKSTTVTIDSSAEIPTFDDEVVLRKKLDELNRKLEIKKVQEQIEQIEKKLDE